MRMGQIFSTSSILRFHPLVSYKGRRLNEQTYKCLKIILSTGEHRAFPLFTALGNAAFPNLRFKTNKGLSVAGTGRL